MIFVSLQKRDICSNKYNLKKRSARHHHSWHTKYINHCGNYHEPTANSKNSTEHADK